MTDKDTVKFTVPSDDKENMRRILRNVYEALTEKGYNPVNQIVGYLLTEDPTYITNYNNARSMICKIDRDELMQPGDSLPAGNPYRRRRKQIRIFF